jgi:ankyrin repeat protein
MTPQETRDALWNALFSKQDFAEASRLLAEDGADLEATNIRGETAALFAAQDHRLDALDWLGKNGANLNATRSDAQKETPLTFAVSANDLMVVNKLLELGADPTVPNGRGITPLLQAFFGEIDKDRGVVQALIGAGADLNAASEMGVTAAMVAATRGWKEWLGVLLSAGADPNVVDCMGRGLLHAAVMSDDAPGMVELILEKAPQIDLDLETKNGSTPLALASNGGQIKVIKLLVDAGANANVRANGFAEEMSPLMISCSYLAAGVREEASIADEERRKEAAETATQSKLQAQAAKKAGAFPGLANMPPAPSAPSITAKSGGTKKQTAPPGSMAEQIPELKETVKKLLASGADVGERDLLGRSVGWHASGVDIETMELLIAGGLDPKEPLGPDGFTPYHAALLCPDEPAVRQDRLRFYAKSGFPVNPTAWTGSTAEQVWMSPLALAVKLGDAESVETLMALGANPSFIEVASGTTALHLLSKLPLSPRQTAVMQILKSPLRSKIENADEEEKLVLDEAKGLLRRMTHALSPKAGDWSALDKNGDTVLGAGIVNGATDAWVEEMIFDFGATVGNTGGRSSMLAALCAGRPDMALALNEIHARQGGDVSALLLEAAYDSPETWQRRIPFLQALRVFPINDAQLELRDENGNTPLIIASATGQPDLVEIFMAMKTEARSDVAAYINAENDVGETAIFQAAATGNSRAVLLLRANGANLEHANAEGRTVRQIAPGMNELSQRHEGLTFEVDALPALELEHLEKMDILRQSWTQKWDGLNPPSKPVAAAKAA